MRLITVDPSRVTDGEVADAGAVLRDGGLVAFPTETVYGLGANALDPAAVARIFAAKGRPTDNPVIVHAPDAETAWRVTTGPTPLAERLAAKHCVAGCFRWLFEKRCSSGGCSTATSSRTCCSTS